MTWKESIFWIALGAFTTYLFGALIGFPICVAIAVIHTYFKKDKKNDS